MKSMNIRKALFFPHLFPAGKHIHTYSEMADDTDLKHFH